MCALMCHIAVNFKHHIWIGHALCRFLIIEVHWSGSKKPRFYPMTDENINLLNPNEWKTQPQHSFSCSHTPFIPSFICNRESPRRFVETVSWGVTCGLWSLTTRFICARGRADEVFDGRSWGKAGPSATHLSWPQLTLHLCPLPSFFHSLIRSFPQLSRFLRKGGARRVFPSVFFFLAR